MSDKSYLPPNGKSYQVLKGADHSFRVKADGASEATSVKVQADFSRIDHETSRIQWTRANKRGLFWIYAVRNKRVLAWPGGSMELDAQDLSEGSAAAGGALKPLKLTMPGKVLSVKIVVGEIVEAGQGLVVVEAMKMENILLAPGKAKIAKIHISTGDRLDSGATLISFEPA